MFDFAGTQQCWALGYAQCFPNEGRQEGRKEGGKEGRKEGMQTLLFALGWRPSGWKETLGLCRQGGEVLQWLAELKWASAQGSGPSPWACRSPPSPPCLSSSLCCPALWQLPAAPDLLPGLPCHLGSQGHRTLVAESGGGTVPLSPAGPATHCWGLLSRAQCSPKPRGPEGWGGTWRGACGQAWAASPDPHHCS